MTAQLRKPDSARRPQPQRVVLIVEDDSDGKALKLLAQRCLPGVRLDCIPAGGIGNIKRKLTAFVELARDRGPAVCVAVLIDQDGVEPARDVTRKEIQAACHAAGVKFVQCVRTMEAWLLADGGCRKYLGMASGKGKGKTDSVRNPKSEVERAYYKHLKRGYDRTARERIAQHACGPDPKKNDSLATALRMLC